jgi:solute:Na+ symporter, SSS family
LRGLTSGALLGGLILALWWKRGASWPVVLGMLVSLGVMTWVTRAHAAFTIYFPWYTMIGCVVTISVAFVARRFSQRRN